MSLFKCKMCGGSLEISGESVATCEYCGSQQTLPKLSDDRRANLYDRANHFRRNNEFDKAMGIYERILNEDDSDAEAYWSLVLCRFGIEYVEDPATRKRLPTVNRAQFTSVFDDDNYRSALRYADSLQRSIYEEEARAINEIQKGILEISQKEEPFDVFICYKETDKNGRRTPDSVLAGDLYHQLTQEGFKVFFSRITLEDKLGTAYEPYIFAALNSARVMVVLGTKPEHFTAVWVRNEWSRYLSMIKNGAKKVLIPAYRDMDPYDLPEEFSHLQAQDMGKLGFMQDLIRGIRKLAAVEEPKPAVAGPEIAAVNAGTAPLLKRAFMFLEDGEWSSADEYCEKVLDMDPECAQAYLGKLMARLRVREQVRLRDQAEPFDDNGNYQKVLRFGDEALKAELTGYTEHIRTRNENTRLEGIYAKAKGAMAEAATENAYKKAAELFESISGYRDSAALAEECREKAETTRKDTILAAAEEKARVFQIASYEEAIRLFTSIPGWKNADARRDECRTKIDEKKAQLEEARKDGILERAKVKMRSERVSSCEEALKLLAEIPGWKDADETRAECVQKIEELKAKETARQAEWERQKELALIKEKHAAKIKRRVVSIAAVVICLVIAFTVVLTTVILPGSKYDKALAHMEAGRYPEAIAVFTELGDYKDSAAKIAECNTAILENRYNDARALLDAGDIIVAYDALIALGGYKDSAEVAKSIYFTYEIESLKQANVGDTVFFGSYEQDNSTSNGAEPVEWIVLDIKGDQMLLISRYCLDCKRYDDDSSEVTWEECSLRKWLNGDFVDFAFTEDEKGQITMTTLSPENNPVTQKALGNPTKDQIFLLSSAEIEGYRFGVMQCQPTAYAVAKGLNEYSNGNCCWWLRGPAYAGGGVHNYPKVDHEGDIVYGYSINDLFGSNKDNGYGIRPAMWINLNVE